MPDYIDAAIETDPATVAEEAFDHLADRVEGWEAISGEPDTILLEETGAMAAEVRDVASEVTTDIFRWFGEKLAALPPTVARAAEVGSTWTAPNALGYTIVEGWTVGIRVAGDELVLFRVQESVTIPPGSTATAAGAVRLASQEQTASANGLGGVGAVAELVEAVDVAWVITLTGLTEFGADEEEIRDYLIRLSTELTLQSPRPILPPDFALLAKRVAEVDRAMAIDLYKPGVNEIQSVVLTGSPTGGTGTLTFEGQTTAGIDWNSTAVALQAKLEALSNIAPGDIVVAGGPWPTTPITVTFTGALGNSNRTQMTGSGAGLTPSGGITITTTTEGAAPETARERAVTVAVVKADGEPVSTAGTLAVDALLQKMREVNFEVFVTGPTYTTIDVTFTATAYAGWDLADVDTRAEQAVKDYLSPANWGLIPFNDERVWLRDTLIRYGELYQVLNAVDGLWRVTNLQLARSGQALAADVNITIYGDAPLPRAGSINGTIVAP